MSANPWSDAEAQGRARREATLRSALAPLEALLTDPRVVEIMLNADGCVWVERAGMPMAQADIYLSPRDAERMLRSVAGELELELHARQPTLSCKLPLWGARMHATIAPITTAPIFALRRPSIVQFELDDYVSQGLLTVMQADALRVALDTRRNMVIGGGTGSGKTTFVNSLLREISQQDRVLIIEDTPELQCASPNRVELLVHPPAYSWRNAVIDAMRYRPDRIIVGEVRDGAALELLKAWNTGHHGGIATVHANDTRAMLDRICQLIEEVLPVAPRELVAQTIEVCVHLRRDPRRPSGRSVSAIDRVVGFDRERGWQLQPLCPLGKGE